MKRITFLLLLIAAHFTQAQQDYFWVGGSGNWSDFATHWATASGGTSHHTQAPTLDDNVYFDANSFNADGLIVTLDIEGLCHDFDWSAITNQVTLEVGASSRVKIDGSVSLSNSMIIGDGVDLWMFSSEAETFSMGDDPEVRKNEETFGGRIEFLGSGSWTVVDHVTNQELITVNNNATLNLDGKPVYTANFSVVSSGTLITGDNTTITTHDWTSTSSNMTFGTNVEIILIDNEIASFARFRGNDNVFGSLTIDNGGKPTQLDGGNTFETLTFAPGSVIEFEGSKTQTVGELVADGTRVESIKFYTDSPGEQAVINKTDGTVDLSFVSMTDMQATGGATFNADDCVDNGNNTGWNFTAPTPLEYYWVGGSGNWSDVNRWATSSGGSSFHSNPPTTFDNVYFDNNSFSEDGQAVTADGTIYCHDMDWSQMTAYDVDLEAENYSKDYLYISGSYFGGSSFANDMSRVYLTSGGSEVVSANGAHRMGVYIYTDGNGSWEFTDDPNPTGITIQSGSSVFTGSTINVRFFTVNNTAFNKSVDLSNVTANFRFLRISENEPLEIAWTDDNSLINVQDEFRNTPEIEFSHLKFVAGASDPIEIQNSSTYGTLEMEPGVVVHFGDGTMHTVDNLILNGTKFNAIDLSTVTEGTQATLSVSSGTVEGNYLILQDIIAAGGATFNANNSTDLGNNTGWNITAPVPLDYYWIGGTGEWDNINNWSQTSGGDANQSSLPGSIDNVYFDQNSFFEDEQVVNLPSGDISFNDFNVTTEFTADFSKSGSNAVDILGSINVDGPADILFDPQMRGKGSETIRMVNGATSRTMRFNSTGTWTFTSGVLVNGDIDLIGGNLDFNEQSVEFNSLYLTGDYGTDFPKTLDASNTELTANYQITISQFSSDFTADFSGSTIHLKGSRLHAFNDQNTPDNLNDIVYHDLIVYDQLELRGNYEFNDIKIEAGGLSLRKINTNTVPEIKFNSLSGIGTVDEPLTLESIDESVQWDYVSKNAVNVDMEYVSIRDSKASGATFTALNSTDNGNNSGWNIQAPPNVPDAPVLAIVSQDVESVTLSWDAVDNADEYKIELGGNDAFTSIKGEQQVSATQVTFTNLDPATIYYARGSSRNDGGFSTLSETVEVLTLPDVPVANEAFSVTADAFTASWNDLDGVIDSYRLDVSEAIDFSSFLGGYEDLVVEGTSLRIEGLIEDGLYYYRLRAVNASGTSSNSETITVSTSVRETQEITFAPFDEKTFGDDPVALTATSSSELAVYYESSNESIAEIVGNEAVILGAGEVTITAFQDGDESFKAATPVSQVLTIAKANQTITFDELPGKTDADDNFGLNATASSGLSVTYESSNLEVATVTGSTVTITGPGNTIITASQEGDSDYNAAVNVTQTLIVEAAQTPQTITFNELPEKTFGDEPFELTATATSGLTVAFRSLDNAVATVSGTELTIVGAGSVTIIASQAGNEEYRPAEEVQRTLIVSKADQTITFSELPEKSDTDADFELAATSSSGLDVSYSSSDQNVATVSGSTVSIVGPGSTVITASQVGDDDYNAASDVEQILVVTTKSSQTITFEELPSKTYGDESFNLTGTASSGLTVSFTSSDENVATISGSEVTIIGAGTAMITASQEGDVEYAPAEDVQQMLIVNKADQIITFSELPEKSDSDEDFELTATASSGLEVTYTSSDPSVATISGSTVSIVGEGSTVITASQAGDDNFNVAEDVEQSLVVTGKSVQTITFEELSSKTYGDDAFTLTASSTSGLTISYTSSDESVASISGSEVTIVGAGTAMITASQEGNDEYLAAENVEQMLTINKADQTIAFEELSDMQVGEVVTISGSTSSGLDVMFIVTGPATLTGNQLEATGEGTVTVTASQGGDANYNAATDVERSFEVTLEVALGIEDELVTVYPNPVVNRLNINSSEPVDLQIYDMKGATVIRKDQVVNSVDLSSLLKGVYVLEIRSEMGVQRMRIQKAN